MTSSTFLSMAAARVMWARPELKRLEGYLRTLGLNDAEEYGGAVHYSMKALRQLILAGAVDEFMKNYSGVALQEAYDRIKSAPAQDNTPDGLMREYARTMFLKLLDDQDRCVAAPPGAATNEGILPFIKRRGRA